MEIKRYKIGVCEIEARLPFNINDTFPFSLFRIENLSDNAYVYDYSFTDNINLTTLLYLMKITRMLSFIKSTAEDILQNERNLKKDSAERSSI